MRVLRILILIAFIITAGLFAWHEVQWVADRDDQPPVISADADEITVSVNAQNEDFLKGMTATDERDGDVTSSLVVAAKSNFIEEGVIRVDYAAFDSHNNVSTYSRTARYSDYSSPRFSSAMPFVFKKSTSYDFNFIKASDVLDGDITNKVKVIYSSLYSATTEAPVTLEVTNSVGDIEKLDLNLRILTQQEYGEYRPALWDYIVYTTPGKEIEPWNYISGVWRSGEYYSFEDSEFEYADITFNAAGINYNVPGVYELIFTLEPEEDKDNPRNSSVHYGSTVMYVIVRDE